MKERRGRRQRLTDTLVERLRPEAKAYTRWCDALPGFGVRVMTSGQKTLMVQYRIGRGRGAKQGTMKLGAWPLHRVDDVRDKAEEALKKAAAGVDPKAEPEQPEISTIEELMEKFIKEHVKVHLKPRTQEEYERAIRRDVIGKLGKKTIRELDYSAISSWHIEMQASPYQANRSLAYLQKALNSAEKWGLRGRHSNPCPDVQRFPEKKRKSYFTDEELESLAAVLDRIDRDEPERRTYVGCVRLLFLTGCRLGEVLSLQWSDDGKCNYLDLPGARFVLRDHKTDQDDDDKVVYMTEAAVEAAMKIPRYNSSNYVVAWPEGGQVTTDAMEAFWARLRKEAGFKRRMHDLRHTFASAGITAGLSLPVIGALLGHRTPATTARYAHLIEEAHIAAATKVGDVLSAAINGKGQKANAEVGTAQAEAAD